MKAMRCIVISLAIALSALQAQAQAQPLPASPSASELPTPFSALAGRWVRPDGGYVISIKSVEASGKVDASYANPNPLPFYAATATQEGGALKMFFELRAGGYNGSTYTLDYDKAGDRLRGVYYQAVAKQSFDVVFVRK
jgi:hypothetical protein